ncbi:MAG: hypothetical protein ACI91Z_001679 [Yoonia sp.]|jgi:uncharacterized protein (DUF1499 family)
MRFLVIAVTLVVTLGFYIRRAPVAPILTVPTVDADIAGGFTAVREFSGDAAALRARIAEIALATPRTQHLRDDPLQFVTRSRVVGFPDVTAVAIQDGVLTMHAHQVYGWSDGGVNKARVLDWLDRLGPL